MKGRRSLGTKFVIAKHKLSLKKLNLKKTPETYGNLINYYILTLIFLVHCNQPYNPRSYIHIRVPVHVYQQS